MNQYSSVGFAHAQEVERKRREKEEMEKEDALQRTSFLLTEPVFIENYKPERRVTGKEHKTHILSESLPNRDDDEMSQQLKNIFHPPVKAKQIDPVKIMKRRTRKKHSPRSAEYNARMRRKTAKIYGKKKPKKVKRSKSAPRGGRRKRKKQRGGNTPECQTREYTYAELENKIGETFYVKVPPGEFWQDGNYILEEYNINGDGNAGHGIGLVGAGNGSNGNFHVDGSDIDSHEVRICKLDDGSEEKRQAGGIRKRRKTRKNKRSKKRRVKKRKTRKRRKKRR